MRWLCQSQLSFSLFWNPNFNFHIITNWDQHLWILRIESNAVDNIVVSVPGQETTKSSVPNIRCTVFWSRTHQGTVGVKIDVECSRGICVTFVTRVINIKKPETINFYFWNILFMIKTTTWVRTVPELSTLSPRRWLEDCLSWVQLLEATFSHWQTDTVQ